MNSPDLQSLISGVLANPDMLQKIMTVASSLTSTKPEGDILESNVNAPPKQVSSASTPINTPSNENDIFSNLPLLNALGSEKRSDPAHSSDLGASKSSSQCRQSFLCALKPFLSEKRQEKIDFILKVLVLLDAAEGFNKFKS